MTWLNWTLPRKKPNSFITLSITNIPYQGFYFICVQAILLKTSCQIGCFSFSSYQMLCGFRKSAFAKGLTVSKDVKISAEDVTYELCGKFGLAQLWFPQSQCFSIPESALHLLCAGGKKSRAFLPQRMIDGKRDEVLPWEKGSREQIF